ncbi:VOC family protein [Fictibacillus sp. Mic-4]|uniref:VOC family protein n=1 Tax=Fictibacillus sp. Mic-4 TaxID=3132826 RepID=UPI003CFB52E3
MAQSKTSILHHIEINVTNLKESAAFWGWILTELGFTRFQTWPDGISWKMGDTYLVFVQTKDKYRHIPYHRCATGLNHLAFWGKSRNFVNEIAGKLKEKGIPLLYEDRYPYAGGPSHYAVFFEDPNRIKVEIVAPD